jgi:hypothetical protein
MQQSDKLTNPYTLAETLERLRHYLAAVQRPDAVTLLEKAETKAKENEEYARRMEAALLHGSTIECRELFSDFGDYWEKTRGEFPFYPHHDAVNLIDTAMFHIKIGDTEQAIEDFNFLHNR